MKRHALKASEPLAIKPSAIERDADGFFIIVGDSAPENEKRGTVAMVHVRGALSQFKGEGGDSYEAIVERVGAAFAEKPTAVLLNISSPGGVVAGLNEAVFAIRKLATAADVPIIAYVNELAASAAFALCCACDRRFAPPSAIVGSVGTISTMVSQEAADKAAGLDFRIITSGARKADGHPHAPISDAAVRAEERRNAQLAEQFFELAAGALRLPPSRLKSLQAAIFVGQAAKDAGLINAVLSLDELLRGLDKTDTRPPVEVAPNEGNVTDRRAKDVAQLDKSARSGTTCVNDGGTGDAHMNLKALIAKTEASIASETDPGQLRVLQAKLGTFMARAEMDDDEPPKKGDDDDDDDSKAKKAEEKAAKAKKAEEKAKIKSKRADAKAKHEKLMAELDDEEARCEGDDEEAKGHGEEEKAKASLSPGAAAALASQSTITSEALTRIQKLEKSAEERELAALIGEAKAQRRITPGEAKTLSKKGGDFVRDFLEMRPRALVNVDDDALAEPSRASDGDVPAFTKSLIEHDIKIKCLDGEAATKYREASYAAHRAAQAGLNGAGGTY